MQTRESHLLDSDGTYNKRQKTCNDSILGTDQIRGCI